MRSEACSICQVCRRQTRVRKWRKNIRGMQRSNQRRCCRAPRKCRVPTPWGWRPITSGGARGPENFDHADDGAQQAQQRGGTGNGAQRIELRSSW